MATKREIIRYFINHRVSDGTVFIAKSKILRKVCICLGTLEALPTDKKITGGLEPGCVGEDIKGNRLLIVNVKPYV